MPIKEWSEKDLVNKWGRKLPEHVSRSLPWDVLQILVSGLSEDTKLPRERLNEVISTSDVSGLFSIASSLDVTAYTSADLLLQDRLVCELFSKYDFPNSPFNKREKAKLRFFEAEELCRETNSRLRYLKGLECDVNRVIHSAIRHIDRILGSFKVDELVHSCRHGPGSTLCVSGPFTTEYFKLCEKSPTVSTKAFPYAEALIEHDRQWKAYLHGVHPFDVVGPFEPITGLGVELSIADFNKVAFVPKNAKTERSIAIEPYFNVFFQLGVGGMIRRRLKRHGINLDSQIRNQMLALKGSITEDLATIDFSMASDTISIETVRLLVPSDWFEHLSRLRSENYVMDGKGRPYQKFSSMGNGYTFELETLIFFAIALSCAEECKLPTDDISVFGDDVIIPSGACTLFIKACNYLGFTINEDKSFTTGPFRESCGEDYLKGSRVRPVFCKELGTVQHVASLSNRLLELNRSLGVGSRVAVVLNSTVNLLRSRIPRDVRRLVVGPASEDVDGYLHTDCLGELSDSKLVRWNRDLQCWEYPTIRFKPRVLKRRDDAMALWLSRSLKQATVDPRERALRLLEMRLGQRFACLSDFIREADTRQITGRKIGELSMGRSFSWTLPCRG